MGEEEGFLKPKVEPMYSCRGEKKTDYVREQFLTHDTMKGPQCSRCSMCSELLSKHDRLYRRPVLVLFLYAGLTNEYKTIYRQHCTLMKTITTIIVNLPLFYGILLINYFKFNIKLQ